MNSIDESRDDSTTFRGIEADNAPTRFARGWHCLGLANAFRDGKPHRVDAFGATLVVFASQSDGELHVLDGYCRHMGGNLTRGTIKDDSIACPFHDWRWGGDGKCTEIPYARRVPRVARTQSWPTLERNGQLFIWHDPQGSKPTGDVTIPAIEGYGTPEWTDWTWNSLLVENANCREIVDNVVDMAHFFYVHYSFPRYFKNVFEGHVATQYMESTAREDIVTGTNYGDPNSTLRSDASYYGPSYMIDKLWIEAHGGVVETVLINCHYPVTPNSFVLQYGAMVKKPEAVSDEAAGQMAAQFAEGVELGFKQDIEIWKHKTRIDNPLLTEEDGPVYQLRRWYEQFYVDVEDVAQDMVNRFEFEVDTERAVTSWKAEVAANLTKAAEANA
ncbi:Rieske 2Fe-2S domain-containing protein [Mycolicibacter sinensis]|jgi:3-ketosteroid 9alpha-monooxygenase subunit A|uniref:Rieske-type oxygenase n=1 Tax=Mycolicibacter sinensis (strain JDM601) TaxID=875328 RepID=A0A1A2EET1_MYCSD|nr:Rieske 2Fe-2S domain-containing protein [Mycolicibacter sinensis]OBG03286.1 3-ketosteroid-9-alpha-hydroxylase [Mycolicibacter sinensis]OBG07688.1 3-ketosteroid-9-alpha-hydroxylase [Mycolicibacter sinensis]